MPRYYRRHDYMEDAVDSFVELPTTANIGDTWVVRDEEALYQYTSDGGGPGVPGWEKIAGSGGVPGGEATYLLINPTDPPGSGQSGSYYLDRQYHTGVDTYVLDTLERSGFVNRNQDTTISYDDGTEEFEITPTGVNFAVYIKGNKYVKTSKETVKTNGNTGVHHIWYDSTGTLQTDDTTSFENIVLAGNTIVASVYWDKPSLKHLSLCDLRHGFVMDPMTLFYNEITRGTTWIELGDLSNFQLNTFSDGSVRGGFNVDLATNIACKNHKQDLEIEIVHNATPTNEYEQILQTICELPVYYKTGNPGAWQKSTATTFPWITAGTGRVAYNVFSGGGPGWTLGEASNGYFVPYFFVATNNVYEPIVSIPGPQSADIDTLKANLSTEIERILSDLQSVSNFHIFSSMKFLWCLILQTDDSYTPSTTKAIIRERIDMRFGNRKDDQKFEGKVENHEAVNVHDLYFNKDGTRTATANLPLGGNKLTGVADPTDAQDAATKAYVDAFAQGIVWKNPVIDFYDPTPGLPVGPSDGDRYIASATANGWTIDRIYEYDLGTTSWIESIPVEGWTLRNLTDDTIYTFDGTNWIAIGEAISHPNLMNLTWATAGHTIGDDVPVYFNTALTKSLLWDSTDTRFEFNDDLQVGGDLDVVNTLTAGDGSGSVQANIQGFLCVSTSATSGQIELGTGSQGILSTTADTLSLRYFVSGVGYVQALKGDDESIGIFTASPVKVTGQNILDINGDTYIRGSQRVGRRSTAISTNSTYDDYIIEVSDTSAPRTVTLRTLDIAQAGRIFGVIDTSGAAETNAITIDTQGGELINGVASVDIDTNYGVIWLRSDGSNLQIINPTDNTGFVHISGAETITGDKTFTGTNKFGDGTTDYTEFDADGIQTMYGEARVYKIKHMSAYSDGVGYAVTLDSETYATAGIATLGPYYFVAYDNSLPGGDVGEARAFQWIPPKDRVSASDIRVRFHWMPADTNVGSVKWLLGERHGTPYSPQTPTAHSFSAKTISAFADAGGGQVTVTSTAHSRQNGDAVTIMNTTNYNGNYTISNVSANAFEITATWVATETGDWYLQSSVTPGTQYGHVETELYLDGSSISNKEPLIIILARDAEDTADGYNAFTYVSDIEILYLSNKVGE